MPFKEVTTTGSDVTIFEVPFDKIYKIKGFYIENGAGSDATIVIKDKYTYNLGSSAGTDSSRTLLKLKVTANSQVNLSRLEGEEIIGELVINTDQQPIYVYVGIQEKGGD